MKTFLFTLLFISSTTLFATIPPLVRFPALNADGSQIAFCYQGDIWIKNLNEGPATRLTVNPAYDAHPIWNSEGTQLLFTSNRYGNNDLFTIDIKTGTPKRITWHSTSDVATDWRRNIMLFSTYRDYSAVEREAEIWSVIPDNATPQRLLDAAGNNATMSPDGRFIAFDRGSCRLEREAYEGPANRNIWIYDTHEKKYIQLTGNQGNDFMPRWGNNRTLYYIGSNNKLYNIHQITINAEGVPVNPPLPITSLPDGGIRSFSISADGRNIAFEKENHIYTLDIGEKVPRILELQLTTDNHLLSTEHKTYTNDIDDMAISPNGKYAALSIHGELFIRSTNKENKRTVRLTNSPARDHQVCWANDTTLIFTSDRDGQFNLYLLRSSDSKEHNLFKSLRHTIIRLTHNKADEQFPVMSPDGASLAYQRGNGSLITAQLKDDKLIKEHQLTKGWAAPSSVSWSPDSRYVAYSREDLYHNAEIYIQPANNKSKAVNISQHPKADTYPVWSPDGSKLGFISLRSNNNNNAWFVWLKKSDWEKTHSEWEEERFEETKNEKCDSVIVTIDFDNIHERLEQVTALPGNESDICFSKDGEHLFYVSNRNARWSFSADQDLYSIKWDGTDNKRLTTNNTKPWNVQYHCGSDKLYMLKNGGKLLSLKPDDKKSSNLDFSAHLTINHAAEREQIFDEACRVLSNKFYDPNFHGEDFDALIKKYRPLALSASTKKDFQYMVNWMLGQINASHMGLYRGENRIKTEKEKSGLLGIEGRVVEEGFLITHVTPNSPANRKAIDLQPGETITMVDDQPVMKEGNFYALFTNKVNKPILLTVKDKQQKSREVIVHPAKSLKQAQYDAWVAERRALTEKYSNGRLGYLHIKGMVWPSFERFERELTAVGQDKEGIVIDVRYNGGGWITDYLMTILTVRPFAYTIPRGATDDLAKNHKDFSAYYPYGTRLPLPAWVKPSVAMCNETSYSNAEIFSHAYKFHKLGKLVGKPTFGAVISTGSHTLIDGSYIRIPGRAWYTRDNDQNMELGPAIPDVSVDNAPDYRATGHDEQLRQAVETLLQQL